MPGLVLVGLAQIVSVKWTQVPAPAWEALAYSSVFSLVLAYFIWNASVQRVGGTRTAIYMCLTPLVAALVAWATLGERLVPMQGAGAVLILTGVVHDTKAGTKREVRDHFLPRTSCSLAAARRRWGMTMLPPTTSPTANTSWNSSSVTPSSAQRTT